MSNKNGKLSWGEKLAYGMGDSGANVVCALTGTYLTAFYTDTVGIATAAVGTMMLLARIFDGVTDIIMGAIVDKTKTRWGKARPWVLWSAPFMALSIILMFNFPSGMSDSGKLIYAYITYIFQNCIVYTANNLPYNALLARMTLDVQDRATASSLRFIMAQLTMLIVRDYGQRTGYGRLVLAFDHLRRRLHDHALPLLPRMQGAYRRGQGRRHAR